MNTAEDAVLHFWLYIAKPVWAGMDLLSYIIIPANESPGNQTNEDFSLLFYALTPFFLY